MKEVDALRARVVEIANEVLQQKRTPYDGAKELWLLRSEMAEFPDALLGVRVRAARSRGLIAKGRPPAVVARVLQVNRSGLYRKPKRRPSSLR